MTEDYRINCWNCLGEFDAVSSVWCSCNPTSPTKVCPFCLLCFCNAAQDYKEKFWINAPQKILNELGTLSHSRAPLGEALVRAKFITSDQLLMALQRQNSTGERLGEILVNLGFITKDTIDYFLINQKSVLSISLKDRPIDPSLVELIGPGECIQRMIIPVVKESLSTKEILTLAMANPSDGDSIEFVQNISGCQVLPGRAKREEIIEALKPFLTNTAIQSASKEQVEDAKEMVVKLIRGAIAKGASDFYVEPREEDIAIHYRIDGILYRLKPLHKKSQVAIIHEVKKMLKLNTDISDRPQEGRVALKSGGKRFELASHSIPTLYGENISMKLIDRDAFLKDLSSLGLEPTEEILLRVGLSAQKGLLVFSSPLFHGGTTTLYSVMKYLSGDANRKAMSLEAQIYCPIPGISQAESPRDDINAIFASLKALSGIRPDVAILADVFENAEIAPIAYKLIGQCLVIATIEATSCINAVRKIISLNISASDLADGLITVVNQRLVRRICQNCKTEMKFSDRSLKMMGFEESEIEGLTPFQGNGCNACSQIGYKGREPLFEVMQITPPIKNAIRKNAADKALLKEMQKTGCVLLRTRCIDKIKSGFTTIDEFQKGNF